MSTKLKVSGEVKRLPHVGEEVEERKPVIDEEFRQMAKLLLRSILSAGSKVVVIKPNSIESLYRYIFLIDELSLINAIKLSDDRMIITFRTVHRFIQNPIPPSNRMRFKESDDWEVLNILFSYELDFIHIPHSRDEVIQNLSMLLPEIYLSPNNILVVISYFNIPQLTSSSMFSNATVIYDPLEQGGVQTYTETPIYLERIEHPQIGFKDLVIDESLRRYIESIVIKPLKTRFGVISSIFMFGSSGSGKTTLASVIGKELGIEVMRIAVESMLSRYFGETEQNMLKTISFLEGYGKNVLAVVRNIESTLASGSRDAEDESSMLRIREMLMRSIRKARNILYVITSSSPDQIPEYVLRDANFGMVKIPLLPYTDRGLISRFLKRYISLYSDRFGVKISSVERVHRMIDEISDNLWGYTARELDIVSRYTINIALSKSSHELEPDDIVRATKVYTIDIVRRSYEMYKAIDTARLFGLPEDIMIKLKKIESEIEYRKEEYRKKFILYS